MVGRAAGAALALALAGRAVAAAGPPAPMEPRRLVKPGGGWFEEALGLEPGGARAALVRTDDATFARVEIVDLGTGATAASFDLPPAARPVERLELLPGAKEVLV